MATDIKKLITDSIATKQLVLEDQALLAAIENAANACIEAFKNDKKVLFCGNGEALPMHNIFLLN